MDKEVSLVRYRSNGYSVLTQYGHRQVFIYKHIIAANSASPYDSAYRN